MSETIGEAYLQIRPSMEGISGEIEQAMGGVGKSSGTSFGNAFTSNLSHIAKTAAAGSAVAVAAVGAAATKTTKMVVDGAKETASYGDNIDKMSQKLGMSAQAYQEWDFVLQQNGASIDSLQSTMKTLSNAADDNKDAFERLGISEEFVKSASPEDLFGEVITQLQGMEESTERTAIASDLLGRNATELAPLLNSGAEATEALKEQAREYGLILSDDAVKASATFSDSLNLMEQTMNGLKNNLFATFLPAMTEVTDGLGKVFTGDMSGLDDINAGIEDFIANISAKLPEIFEVGGEIVMSLATAILAPDNIQNILTAVMGLMGQFVDCIIENLPMLIETGLQMIFTIATGIAEALPTLIPTIIEIILNIVEYLIDNVDMLIDGAIALIMGLAEGLINALPILIEKIPEIVIKIVEALIRNAPKILMAAVELILALIKGIIQMGAKVGEAANKIGKIIVDFFKKLPEKALTWGKDLLTNFINGIKEKITHLKETISNVANTVKDFLGFSEPDKGPLSNFHTYAPDMMNLFADGIRQNMGVIEGALDDMTGTVKSEITTSATVEYATPDREPMELAESGDVYGLLAQYLPFLADRSNVNVSLEGDADGLFRMIRNQNQNYIRRTGQSAFA